MKPFLNEDLYRTVSGRCALPLEMLAQRLPQVEEGRALDILREQGFQFQHVDPVSTALDWAGKARYQFAAPVSQAPDFVDCSGFIKWVYGRLGLLLPRRSIQQSRLGVPVDQPGALLPGDLVFSQSRNNRKLHGDSVSVGHVGMFIGKGAVIHASREAGGVEVTSTDLFWRQGFACCRRILLQRFLTALIPEGWDTERADDMVCVVYDIFRNEKPR